MANAGNFSIRVRDPHPAWCDIRYDGKEIATIHHGELSDLKYVVEKAMQEARDKLPDKYKNEV